MHPARRQRIAKDATRQLRRGLGELANPGRDAHRRKFNVHLPDSCWLRGQNRSFGRFGQTAIALSVWSKPPVDCAEPLKHTALSTERRTFAVAAGESSMGCAGICAKVPPARRETARRS